MKFICTFRYCLTEKKGKTIAHTLSVLPASVTSVDVSQVRKTPTQTRAVHGNVIDEFCGCIWDSLCFFFAE
eukprot:COSAG05_NODE_2275_length_3297_cov_87.259225_8_plen_71_part_00